MMAVADFALVFCAGLFIGAAMVMAWYRPIVRDARQRADADLAEMIAARVVHRLRSPRR